MPKVKLLQICLIVLIGQIALGQNYSLSFDGEDDYVDIFLNNGGPFLESTPGTIAFWFKKDEISALSQPLIVSDRNAENNFFQFKFLFDDVNDHKLVLHVRDETFGIYEHIFSMEDLDNDEWHFATATIDADSVRLYVNSVLQGSEAIPDQFDFMNSLGRIQLAHSERIFGDPYSNPKLDQVSIWSIALGQEEIQVLMLSELLGTEQNLQGLWNLQSGSGNIAIDSSPNSNNGTIFGATWSEDVPDLTPGVHIVPDEYLTIQEAIDVSVDGDTVLVQPGTYFENINFNGHNIVLGSLFITTGDTSYISQTVIDGDQSGTVVLFENAEDSSTVLSGFTITNGGGVTHGGGVFCVDSSPTIHHSRIIGNNAGNGAGILCSGSNSHLSDLIIMNNYATEDGGGYLDGGSSAVQINRVIVTSNSAGYRGGGICCWTNSQTIIESATIAHNIAGMHGGGVAAGNSADPIISNSIVWGNDPQELSFFYSHPGNTISVNCSDVLGGNQNVGNPGSGTIYWLDGNFDSDPLFCDPANNDYTLNAYSPCLPGNHPNGNDCGLIGALGHGCGALPEPIFTEDFNHDGALPEGWTIESQSASRTTPWSMQLDSGDDWSVFTEQIAYDTPFEEWLISPVYDLTYYQDAELGFYHEYIHAASSALVNYSLNEGLSWNPLTSFSSSTGGIESLDISAWADETAHLRFAFVFTGEFATGGASWEVDDFSLHGTPIAPTADTPVPTQPPVPWVDFTGTTGCTFHQPLLVDASTVEVRIDANGDGDYDDGGAEDWTTAAAETDLADLAVTTTVTFLVNDDSLAFEFRARTVDGDLWGYSGAYGVSGIADDWVVSINVDLDPPVFTDAYPPLQPDPDWQGIGAEVGVTVSDLHSGVDGSSIQLRVDLNQDDDYDDDGEDWQPVDPQTNDNTLVLLTPADGWGDGIFKVEYSAIDVAGNGPSYSMGEEGIADDIVVKVDATPPTASVLFAQGAGLDNIVLQFSPSVELFFNFYQLQISEDEVFDGGDLIWGPAEDPALSEITTWQTTVTGLEISTLYWVRMQAHDLAGNEGEWSNTVSVYTEGTQLAPVNDLTASVVDDGVLLSWPPVTTDIYGGSDINLEHYNVYSSDDFWFELEEGSLIATTEENQYLIDLSQSRELMAAYRVTAQGSGVSQPEPGMALVPAGSFTMGPDPWDHGSAHPITLTHNFWMDETEVTNSDYLIALQWAYDHALVTADTTTVAAYGVELLDLDDEDCEIAFSPTTGQFTLMMRDHITEYGWGPGQAYPDGYDPGVHPVKETTWYGAACYCDWLSGMTELTPFYQGNWILDVTHNPYEAEGYRLPMEAEWEYAARFDDGRIFPWGNNFPIGCGTLLNHSLCIGWTVPVGTYLDGASTLGLLDMSGNVVEFVNDWYADEYALEQTVNPLGVASGTNKVSRGGDFGDAHIYYSETVSRQSCPVGNYSMAWRGFRAVRSLL